MIRKGLGDNAMQKDVEGKYCEAHCKGGVVGISGREGGAKECQSFCQVPITLDFLPTPNQPDPDLKPKSTAQGFSQNGHIFEILP